MILGFNIGNTNTVLGIYAKDGILPEKTRQYRTQRGMNADGLCLLLREFFESESLGAAERYPVEGIALASVVPELNPVYRQASEKLWSMAPLVIGAQLHLGIRITYDDPSRLGVDRIVNAVAAYNEYKRDCVIISLGTAMTFCVLHREGRYDGGIITSGAGIAIDGLSKGTSQLPRVALEPPTGLIATNTIEALKSGFYFGWISMIEGIIARIERKYGKTFLILLTGGDAAVLSGGLSWPHLVDPHLTMKGIKYIYDLNV